MRDEFKWPTVGITMPKKSVHLNEAIKTPNNCSADKTCINNACFVEEIRFEARLSLNQTIHSVVEIDSRLYEREITRQM